MTSLASCRREVKVGGWGGCHCHPCLGCWLRAHGVLFSGSELHYVSAKPSGRSCSDAQQGCSLEAPGGDVH